MGRRACPKASNGMTRRHQMLGKVREGFLLASGIRWVYPEASELGSTMADLVEAPVEFARNAFGNVRGCVHRVL